MATGSTEFVDATTAASFIVTLYSKRAIVAREQAMFFAGAVDRKYESELTYGSTLKIPAISNLTVQSKNTSSNAAVTFETVTEAQTTLTVGTWEYHGIAVESFTETQADRDLLSAYAPKQGYALGLSLDASLATLIASLSNNIIGSPAQELEYSDMLRAIQYLDDANAPQEDRAVIISPAQRAGFEKLDQFIHSDYSKINGSWSDAMKAGSMGMWKGLPIFVTTHVNGSNTAGHDNTLLQRECIALIVQMTNKVHKWFDLNYLADKVVVEHIYGSGIVRDDHGVWLKGA